MARKVLLSGVLLLSVFSLFAFFPGCGDKTKPAAAETIDLDRKVLNFDENESAGNIFVSSNAQWTLSNGDVDWLTGSLVSGNGNAAVRITADANQQTAIRTSVLTFITGGGISRTVDVTQGGLEPYIMLEAPPSEALPTGEELTVTVLASGAWTSSIPDAATWIAKKSQTEAQAIFTVAANQTAKERMTVIVFKLEGTGKQVAFALSQSTVLEGIDITPEQTSLDENGGEVTVDVTSERTWKVSIPAADTWVKLKQQTAGQAIFTVEKNVNDKERKSSIAFQNASGVTHRTLVLTQAKSSVTVYPGYDRMGELGIISAALVGRTNSYLHTNLFSSRGFDYSEYPNCTGFGGYPAGTHLEVVNDATLQKPVLRFYIHVRNPNHPNINGGAVATTDRCGSSDRQRNELKSATNNTTWAKMQAHKDEWQILKWKMRIPKGYQPTSSFCHVHQIKAQDGSNNGSPVITVTLRANSDGSNRRVQIIHSAEGSGTGRGTVTETPIADFEDEWVQIEEEMHFMPEGGNGDQYGFFRIKITRIRDDKVLMNFQRGDIEMIRKTATYLRNKYGIYRSLGGDIQTNPANLNKLLKDEYIDMCDFEVWRKNHNPNPATAM